MTIGVHFHLCPEPDCGNIWHHDRAGIQPGGRVAAHTCPKCKKGVDYWAKLSMREAVCCRRVEREYRTMWGGDAALAWRNLKRELEYYLLVPILAGILWLLKLLGGK